MLSIQSHVSLKPYNTFRIDASARYWVDISNEDDLQTLLQLAEFLNTPKLILGGGSNVLLCQNFDGLAIKISLQGIDVVREDDTHVYVKAGGGVNWHQLVMHCVDQGYAGIENLSLIPGTVGAAPMQNIGAYGVELEQVFDSLTAVHIQTGHTRTFTHADCAFGYRESVFKRELKGQYIITSVTLRLDKVPTFHTRYGAIQETLADMGVSEDNLSIKAISEAVIHIRRSKLPDPAQIGNAGSFFKNPEIPKAQFDQLKTEYPTLPGYPVNDDFVKVPAGWLIEQAGWKGHRSGDAGVHAKQALVLVNYDKATGNQILALAQQVQESVQKKYGITISPEVNVIR
ncbi:MULTISPECIES: UDP-N-acetylmuramate dehydrogenase [unclassified Spirosoma]|uniref:UDP-N-acetylmuramate dehydrogenase n=1 Tax=unclassified Spirosoma TaxID=2621999 RepID=UPI0009606857|nr:MULTISPECIES: UDP-N-acetylmuramate dehydrogenase [unclassified Spirosoma]MBN8823144.1 UDP-N-acetylmuramate dehydrogenase [Spirosoma sp.]OJW73229.1 MAG: UDP-N-acetylenolpyruvoylglucosamine reductase [Spirosoma sp. 48-14]